MKATLEKIIPALESETGAGWKLYDDGRNSFEFSTYSPSGENVIIALDGSTLTELAADAHAAADAFDAEGHAAEIYTAKHFGTEDERRFYSAAPYSLRDLLEDAEAIAELYKALESALKAAEVVK